MAYYFKYKNVDLTNVTKMQTVEMPSLPSMTHSSINSVFNRDGEIYNGLNYGNREITLQFIVQPDNITQYHTIIQDIKQVFYTKEVAPLYLGDENLYIWAIPVGDLEINELGNYCSKVNVTLIAYDPYWYSANASITNNDNKKMFTVINTSDLPTYPMFYLSVDKDAHFIQIDNQTTGKSILLGQYPSLIKHTIPRNQNSLVDECRNLSKWFYSDENIDSGRANGGSLSISHGGSGIVCGNFGGSNDSIWHGACYRRTLDNPCTNFKATFDISFTSTGVNGDPTKPYESNIEDTVISGVKGIYYEVIINSVNVRSEPSIENGEQIGTLTMGYKLTDFIIVNNNWLNINYNGENAYVSTKDLTKKVGDGTVTTQECNYVVIKSVNLRTQPAITNTSSIIRTIPVGAVVRCYTEKFGTSQEFLKLAQPYEGDIGYMLEEDYLITANDYEVSYDYELNTADDKTGIIEVYGYTNDNTQLFKVSMYDDNMWYEHNIPQITYNNKTILTDRTVASNPKEYTKYSENGADKKRYLSGEYGDWNNVEHCEFYIERLDNRFWASISRIDNGMVTKKITSASSYLDTSQNANKELAYIVLYIGTSGDDVSKASDMMLNYVIIKNEDASITSEDANVPQIVGNSSIIIDSQIPQVSVNNQIANDLVDIGSDFFALEKGENIIKINSDANINCDVIYNERYL